MDQVQRVHHRVIITKHGPPAAGVLSVGDQASLEKHLEIMVLPALLAQIRGRLAELKQ